jgi:hypothetical protein
MATKRVLSRRDLLRRGALGLGALAGLSACSKHEAFSCTRVDGLSVEEILPRNRLAYVDIAPDPAKTCASCQQFVPPPTEDRCGGCKILKGPVHPGGTCKSYVAKG